MKKIRAIENIKAKKGSFLNVDEWIQGIGVFTVKLVDSEKANAVAAEDLTGEHFRMNNNRQLFNATA